MSQINLYYKTQLETNINLFPKQIMSNIDEHILENLITKVKGKVTEYGIIMKINNLLDYNYGIIDKSNLTGTTIYSVKYECLLCSPVKDLEIICTVENIIKGFIIGQNGPITVAIAMNNIDLNKFNISIADNSLEHIKSKKKINKKDYIKVSIIEINNELGEKNIITICKLINIANDAEIKRYLNDMSMIYSDNDIVTTSSFI